MEMGRIVSEQIVDRIWDGAGESFMTAEPTDPVDSSAAVCLLANVFKQPHSLTFIYLVPYLISGSMKVMNIWVPFGFNCFIAEVAI